MKGTKVMGACMGLLALALVGFVACDNGTTNGQEKPIKRTDPITVTLDKAYTVNITGTMFEAEWSTAKSNIVNAVEAEWAVTGETSSYRLIFGEYDLTIILENTTAYNHYNYVGTIEAWNKLNLNQNWVLNAEPADLQAGLTAVFVKMDLGEPSAISKAVPVLDKWIAPFGA